jgi:hypothetical protein
VFVKVPGECSRRSRPSHDGFGRNGAQVARARRCLPRRQRTLANEHRSGTHTNIDGRRSGNTFLLVSPERLSDS